MEEEKDDSNIEKKELSNDEENHNESLENLQEINNENKSNFATIPAPSHWSVDKIKTRLKTIAKFPKLICPLPVFFVGDRMLAL